jgi:pimeloyl-ACP methyl ester carboxylesterase
MQPTIVLVHGAFAESSSWDAVIDPLVEAGHPVIAAANPLRGLASDAAAVADVVRAVDGPVVLAAHSYGGAVISNVPADAGDIVGLVYANGFAPDAGDSCFALAGMFPGSELGEATLRPVPRSDGTTDLYLKQDSFHDLFCPDVPAPQAARMAATQRPATQEALVESSGEGLWKDVPSWFLIGEDDRIIPPALQHYMAKRAGAHRVIEIPGASHAITVSHPDATAHLILEAAASRVESETVVAEEVIEHVLARAHQTADANEARAVFHVARSIADELAQTDPGFDPVRFIEASTDRS